VRDGGLAAAGEAASKVQDADADERAAAFSDPDRVVRERLVEGAVPRVGGDVGGLGRLAPGTPCHGGGDVVD